MSKNDGWPKELVYAFGNLEGIHRLEMRSKEECMLDDHLEIERSSAELIDRLDAEAKKELENSSHEEKVEFLQECLSYVTRDSVYKEVRIERRHAHLIFDNFMDFLHKDPHCYITEAMNLSDLHVCTIFEKFTIYGKIDDRKFELKICSNEGED